MKMFKVVDGINTLKEMDRVHRKDLLSGQWIIVPTALGDVEAMTLLLRYEGFSGCKDDKFTRCLRSGDNFVAIAKENTDAHVEICRLNIAEESWRNMLWDCL